MSRRVQWICLGLILMAGAYLRFSHLDLLEFKSDEAYAAHLALQFVKGGNLPTAGLMSSVGVKNPPLFIYLIIPMFALSMSITFASCCIATLGLVAVAACWWIGRKYHGPMVGLVAAALFAVSPWAVIYSRKIWAQDFVPVFATATMWAVYALVLGKKTKAVFWALLLPLCVIQIHFSGFALMAAVLAILLVLRPKIDWRFAAAGIAVAALVAVPYLQQQSKNDWAEYRTFMAQRRARNWQIPQGMTINPESGYPFPRRPSEAWTHALAIMNAGEIEDVLGLSKEAFDQSLTLGNWLLTLQRQIFLVALIYLVVMAARAVRTSKRFPFAAVQANQTAWILALWFIVPLVVFWFANLWTYLSYYAILVPVHFLAIAVLAQTVEAHTTKQAGRVVVYAIVGLLVVANLAFLLNFFQFIERNGGAHGTYGTVLAHKEAAARWLAERADVQPLMTEQRLVQMDRLGRGEMPQLDLPFLAVLQTGVRTTGAPQPRIETNTVVLVVDGNRANFNPQQIAQLAGAPQTNFGPMRLYLLQR